VSWQSKIQNPKSKIQNQELPIVLFKLGGSLLTLPDLGDRVRAALQQRPHARGLLVVGGGAAAEVVREWDRRHHLGDALAHQLAIKAMSVTAFLAAAILEQARVAASLGEIHAAWEDGGLPVLLAESMLAALESPTDRLPPSWDVTSDSIAAWLAPRTGADELVLLKSADLPAGGIAAAVRSGMVDRCFPDLIEAVPKLSWVNLRSSDLRFVDCDRTTAACQPVDA
jgi:aspartokinase-like uncharacterized kinase